MTTTVTKTVNPAGAGGGFDFSTLQAWHDAAPASLTVADEVWQGLASGNFSGSSGTLLLLAANSTDATRYMELTTAASASFRDNANVQTNALRWNSSNGCSATNSGSYGVTINASAQANFRMSKLQVQATTSKTLCATFGTVALIDGCIFEGAKNGNVVSLPGGSATIKNSLVVQRIASASSVASLQYGSTALNCTFVTPSDLTKPSAVINGVGGAANIKNCGMFWGTVTQSGGSTPTYTTSGTDDVTTGVTQFTYNTSLFQNISDATRDFRLPSGSGLIGAGTVDNTNAPTDIAGTTRGASNDIGCWQFVAAGTNLWAQSCL
jgi:hypothetical protein